MGKIYNRLQDKKKRQKLRHNSPKPERELWELLKGKKLNGYKFRRQYGVGPFVIDFYCPKLKLAIEIDGDSHFEDGVEEYDKRRQKYIEKYGIHFLRFSNEDVFEDPHNIFCKIKKEIDSFK